ncbi:hypothetical protein AVEN_258216-1 [Araneus ventricosus]|uniref:Uncharacterized protein n=1 Tax=Araneus ventricosus TaxID=182803 RepID=A0A4Y2RPU7_ARAVE|nr:hypothetical protein AVEN_258216-1 [Araneus ventricosus]
MRDLVLVKSEVEGQTLPRWCREVRGEVPSQVSFVTSNHGSKLRGPPKIVHVLLQNGTLSPTCSHGKNTTRRHFTRGNGNAFSPLFFDDAHVSGTGSRKFMGSLLAQQQVPATGLLESPPLTQKREATSTSSAADPPTLLALGFSHESSGNRLFKRERTLNGAWCSPWLHAFERCEWWCCRVG